ncbi:hypothetical protein MASR1M45_22610 [Candidatus Kapaibacterium sp.]
MQTRKLAVVSRGNEFLIDLTNGQTIHTTKYPEGLYINYWGDRYYIFNVEENILREYDIKTKEFIRIAKYRISSSDSSVFVFNKLHNSLLFYNANSGELLDSFKIPGSPDEPLYSLTSGQHRSYDARYIAFHLQLKNNPEQNHFFLYDRQAREIILRKDLPANNDLIMQFFNKSNLMAYSENIKLPEDDKPYSYIRIYDPDQRKVIKDIKLNEELKNVRRLVTRIDDKYILFTASPGNNVYFYDYSKESISDFKLTEFPGPLYFDDSLYVTFGSFEGYKFDWNAVGIDDEPNPSIPVIYPNPTTNSINLNIDEKYFNGQWQLTDLNGKDILNGIILSNPQLQIDISNLPSATYYLRLQNDNFTVTYSVLKM